MISEEEKEEIINKAVEKALLMIPEVIGNLMAQNAIMMKVNTKFYNDNPEFKNYKHIVASVVEMEESKNPNVNYEKLLYDCVPEIKRRIAMTNKISGRR